jgi:chorismate-pyruvate lyase
MMLPSPAMTTERLRRQTLAQLDEANVRQVSLHNRGVPVISASLRMKSSAMSSNLENLGSTLLQPPARS